MGFISDYSKLTEKQFDELKEFLKQRHMLHRLQDALRDFLELYPKCPLVGFLDNLPTEGVDISYINQFEKRYAQAEDKRARAGILIQSQVVYMGFVIGKLKVFKGLALADFPEILYYPDTKRSLEVGASVCSLINGVAGQMLPDFKNNAWVQYFWKRNFEIRPIGMSHLSHEKE